MAPAGIFTLVIVAVVVAALAYYLIRVAVILRGVSFTLGTIIAGLTAIAHQAEPLRPVMDGINRDLGETRSALESLVARKNSEVG